MSESTSSFDSELLLGQKLQAFHSFLCSFLLSGQNSPEKVTLDEVGKLFLKRNGNVQQVLLGMRLEPVFRHTAGELFLPIPNQKVFTLSSSSYLKSLGPEQPGSARTQVFFANHTHFVP